MNTAVTLCHALLLASLSGTEEALDTLLSLFLALLKLLRVIKERYRWSSSNCLLYKITATLQNSVSYTLGSNWFFFAHIVL